MILSSISKIALLGVTVLLAGCMHSSSPAEQGTQASTTLGVVITGSINTGSTGESSATMPANTPITDTDESNANK
jgi:predicted component of type VI protein secretion system